MAWFTNTSLLLAGSVLAGSIFLAAPAWAQHTSELGLGLGVTNYKGEVSPQLQWQNSRLGGTIFYRKDVSAPITLRAAFTAGSLRATDANVMGVNSTTAPLPAYRRVNLKGSVVELSGALEYNFLDYHLRREQHRVHASPYLFIGVAGFYANTTVETENYALQQQGFNRSGGRFGFAIPAGGGVKLALTEHINLGAEMGVRKTFTDQFDHLSDQDILLVNPHDQDWYYYTGLSVSYTFYSINCPPAYKHNRRLLE